MITRDYKKTRPRSRTWRGRAIVLLGLMTLGLESHVGLAQEPLLTKYQIEAVFLLNFAKYVEWPATAFPDASSPMTIGVAGIDPFGDDLQHTVEGKAMNGHPFVIKHLAADSDLSGCAILFVSHSESARVSGILEKASVLPILTVGEDEVFSRNGGIIKFLIKNGNVRLEIDLSAARKAGLTISSRLLAVADVVKGKAN